MQANWREKELYSFNFDHINITIEQFWSKKIYVIILYYVIQFFITSTWSIQFIMLFSNLKKTCLIEVRQLYECKYIMDNESKLNRGWTLVFQIRPYIWVSEVRYSKDIIVEFTKI
jgi:hypothetical protein